MNPELQLLSKIVREDALKRAIDWGLREKDFFIDEARVMYQGMLIMMRDPRFDGSTPGVNMMRTLYEHFELCDDASMSLEAYCLMVRANALRMETQGAIRAAVASDTDPEANAKTLIERLQTQVLAVGTSRNRDRVTAASFAAQPTDADMRAGLLIPDLLIGPGAPTLIVAPGFAGKTALAQALALAVATGRPAFDRFPVKRGDVLHVDGEQGRLITEQRYRQLARGMCVDLTEVDNLQVQYKPPPLVTAASHGRVTMNESEWREIVRKFDLVIFDNLAALTLGVLQENSAEIRSVLDMLGRLSEETNSTIVVLHHTTKPRPQGARGRAAIRGSGAIFEAASIVLMVERTGDDTVIITNEKARGGLDVQPPPPLRVTKVQVGADAYLQRAEPEGRPVSAARNVMTERCQGIVATLQAAGGTVNGQDALRKLCRMGSAPFRTALDKLKADGLIEVGRGFVKLLSPKDGSTPGPTKIRTTRNSHRVLTVPRAAMS